MQTQIFRLCGIHPAGPDCFKYRRIFIPADAYNTDIEQRSCEIQETTGPGL